MAGDPLINVQAHVLGCRFEGHGAAYFSGRAESYSILTLSGHFLPAVSCAGSHLDYLCFKLFEI